MSRAYLLRLPLNDEDVVDGAAILRNPTKAVVRRHWSTEPDERGYLVSSGHDLAMRCDGRADRLLQLDGTPVRLGRKVSVVEPDGSILPFNVSSIR